MAEQLINLILEQPQQINVVVNQLLPSVIESVIPFVSVKGADGLNGIQGIQGIQGTQGLIGNPGIKGDTGLQGISGVGTQGIQGIAGIQGIQGITGSSANVTAATIKTVLGITTLSGSNTGDNPRYASEIVVAPTSGTLTLKLSTETYAGTITSLNVFTVALPASVVGVVNESILIFKIGATLPTITHPTGIAWRGAAPTLVINTSWTISYEQVNTTGSTFEVWAIYSKNA